MGSSVYDPPQSSSGPGDPAQSVGLTRRRALGLPVGLAAMAAAGHVAPALAQTSPPAATPATPDQPTTPPETPAAPRPPFDITTLPQPPLTSRQAFIDFGVNVRHEDADMLGKRWDRYQALVSRGDLWRDKEKRAFLMTPREIFALRRNRARAYDHAYLDIGWGVTISGPHIVGRMTSVLDLTPGKKSLEIGTGSGYQSAVLSYLTDKAHSIEIIRPLAERTRETYDREAAAGYPEFGNIRTKAADGYHGWPEEAPFDAIIVTCAIDHIPPPLLQQLAVGGIMCIPVGPMGAQTLLKVTKTQDASGNISITRENVYRAGFTVSFVPFTREGGGNWSGHGPRQ